MEKEILNIENKQSLLDQNPLQEGFDVNSGDFKEETQQEKEDKLKNILNKTQDDNNQNNQDNQDNKGNDKNPPGVISMTPEELEKEKKLEFIFNPVNKSIGDNTSLSRSEQNRIAKENALKRGDLSDSTSDKLKNELFNKEIPKEKSSENIITESDAFSTDNTEINRLSDIGQRNIDINDYTDFIDNPIRHDEIDYQRAVNQTNWGKFGNAVGRFITGVAPEFINQTAGAIEGIVNFFREEKSNEISEAMQYAKNIINEDWFKIHLKDPEKNLAFDDFGWYMDRGSSLGTSIVSFIALGYLTGGMSFATRLTNLAKAGKMTKFMKTAKSLTKNKSLLNKTSKFLNSEKAARLAGAVDQLTSSYLLTNAEGVGVANDVRKQAYNEKLKELQAQGLSTKEADLKAKEYSDNKYWKAYRFIMINVGLNLTSIAPFLRKTNITSLNKIAKRSLKKSAFKTVGESFQETLEEEVSFLAEKFANNTVEEFYSNLGKYVFEDESLEAMLLGASGGMGQTNLTIGSQFIPTKYNKAEGRFESNYTDYKKNLAAQEDLQKQMKKEGKSKFADFLDISFNFRQQLNYNNKINELEKDIRNLLGKQQGKTLLKKDRETINSKVEELEKLKNNSFYERAKESFDTGLTEDFENMLDVQIEKESKKENKENVELLKAKKKEYQDLKDIYNSTSSLIKSNEIYEVASRKFSLLNTKKNADKDFEKVKKSIDNAIETFNKEIENEDNKLELIEDKVLTKSLIKSNKKLKELQNRKKAIEKSSPKKAKVKNSLTNTANTTEKKEIIDNKLEKVEKDLSEEIENNKLLQKEIDEILSKSSDILNDFKTRYDLNNNINSAIKETETLYNKLISDEGQYEAYQEYLKSKKEYKRKNKKAKVNQEIVKNNKRTKEAKEDGDKSPLGKKDDFTSINKENVFSVFIGLVKNIDNVSLEEFLNTLKADKTNTIIKDLFFVLKYNSKNSTKQKRLLNGLIQFHYNNIEAKTKNILEGFLGAFESNELNGDNIDISLEDANNTLKVFKTEFETFINELGEKSDINDIVNNFNFNSNKNNKNSDASKAYEIYDLLNQDNEKSDNFKRLMDNLMDKYSINPKKDKIFNIIDKLEEALGEEVVKKLFYKIEGYIAYNSNRRPFYLYSQYLKSKGFDTEIKTKEDNPLQTKEDINEANFLRVKTEHIEDEGIIKDEIEYEDVGETDKKVKVSAKSLHIANKIAYKMLDYSRITNSGFSSKQSKGVSSFNTELDERIILDQIKKGDKVTFTLLDSFEDSKGRIFKTTVKEVKDKKGNTVIDENGNIKYNIETTIEEEGKPTLVLNGLDYAPIGININGVSLKDAYLHIPEFVNEDNLAKFSEEKQAQQIEELRNLRYKALTDNNFSMKIKSKTKGHLSFKEFKPSNQIFDSDVKVGIVEGNKISSDKKMQVSQELYDGSIVAQIENFIVYLHKTKLDENKDIINSISEIVRLKFIKENELTDEDLNNIEFIKDTYNVDLRKTTKNSYEDFNNLLNNFIFTKSKNYSNIKFNKILSSINSNNSNFILTNYKNSIRFKFGVGGQNSVSINLIDGKHLSGEFLDKKLEDLKFTLKKATFNFNGEKLKQNDAFSLPLLDENKTFKEQIYSSYKDFILKNTSSNFESYNYKGKKIYSFQKSYFMEESEIPFNNNKYNNNNNNNDDFDDFSDLEEDFNEFSIASTKNINSENIEFKDDNNKPCSI